MNGSQTSWKLKYRQFCNSAYGLPIFSNDWWLDAVCGEDNWDVALVEKSGSVRASMPYYIPNRWAIKMPQLTQTMGPHILPGEGKYTAQLSLEMKLMSELITQLPDVWYFNQNFHYGIKNWLPFFWKGYMQTTQYTYIIDDLQNTDKVWENIAGKQVRSPIRKAVRDGIRVVYDRTFDEFLDICNATFKRQGLHNHTSRGVAQRMWRAVKERRCGKMFFAVDKEERIHAAALLVWTPECAYYLMGGGVTELRCSGAQNFVVWESIKFAATVSKAFDFEGSMLENVENSFRRFGAKQVPYFMISRCQPIFAFMRKCWQIISRTRRRVLPR